MKFEIENEGIKAKLGDFVQLDDNIYNNKRLFRVLYCS